MGRRLPKGRTCHRARDEKPNEKLEIWRELGFNLLFNADDWRGTEKGNNLERNFGAVGGEVIYLPYTLSTSSGAPRKALQNIDVLAGRPLFR